MRLVRFFILHSLRDLWRNRTRTAFALVCVATGVAAVVALRSLAFMVADELTSNLAEMNRGDMRLAATRNAQELTSRSVQGSAVFSEETLAVLRSWARREDVEITFARMNSISSVRHLVQGETVATAPILALFVEPQLYPFYGSVTLEDGRSLADVFEANNGGERLAARIGPHLSAVGALSASPGAGGPGLAWATYPTYRITHARPLVISSNLRRTSTLALSEGEFLRIGASDVLYIVAGIVPASAETILSTPQTALIDFIYVPFDDLAVLGDVPLPDQVYVRAPLGRDVAALDKSLIATLENRIETDEDIGERLSRVTIGELAEQNAETADVIDDMILVMGLSSLLIGGIGIINTMLVVVSRRTLEIAVLKTLGLKAYRVTTLFLVEAALLGLIGSLLGVGVGVLLSYLVKSVGEEAFGLALVWRPYPEAMLSGMFLGMVITMLFGFLPTLIAGQVRPAIVLRPNEAQMPAAGLLQTLATLLVMIGVLGMLVNSIVEGIITINPAYMIAGAGALIGLFAGVIISNLGVGRPIPDYYVFRLPRRFDRLDRWITKGAGALAALAPGQRDQNVDERGRAAVTTGLRGLRQTVLLYGALAVGAVLASGIMLIVAESWRPLQLGEIKPPGYIRTAIAQGDALWVAVWLALTVGIGLLVRWYGRALSGMIALGSIGVTVGGGIGWFSGKLFEELLQGTEVWNFLSAQATGIVLVEGALALLGAIFVGYWLLVWVIGKLPSAILLAVMSLTVLLAIGAVGSLLMTGSPLALAAVAIVVAGGVLVWWRAQVVDRPADSGSAAREPGQVTSPAWGGALLLSGVLVLGGVLATETRVRGAEWLALIAGVVAFLVLWRALRHRLSIDGRLVLREMSGRRTRVASTLLGLSVGVAGLSLVSLTTGAVSHILEFQLAERAEGNLLVITRAARQGDAVREALDGLDGIEYFSQFATYRAELISVNGEPPVFEHGGPFNIAEETDEDMPEGAEDDPFVMTLSERQSLDDLPTYEMVEGRQLTPADAGKNLIMLRETFLTEGMGLGVGDVLRFGFRSPSRGSEGVVLDLEVVGLVARQSAQVGFGDQYLLPPDTLPAAVEVLSLMTIVQVNEDDPAYMDQAMIALSDVPGAIPLELSALTQLLESLLEQLNAIPTLVAWLALVAGTAIIANTVALATQERRRQIGVMKAVGLKGRRVLGMLMIENGLIGLLAGLIGAGVGLLVTVAMVLASQSPEELARLLELSTIGWLILVGIGVAIGAAMLSAWGAAAEKPMNVLRYE